MFFQVAQELDLSQQFPSHTFLQQEPSPRAPGVSTAVLSWAGPEGRELQEPCKGGAARPWLSLAGARFSVPHFTPKEASFLRLVGWFNTFGGGHEQIEQQADL